MVNIMGMARGESTPAAELDSEQLLQTGPMRLHLNQENLRRMELMHRQAEVSQLTNDSDSNRHALEAVAGTAGTATAVPAICMQPHRASDNGGTGTGNARGSPMLQHLFATTTGYMPASGSSGP